jgi:hypothetical protein
MHKSGGPIMMIERVWPEHLWLSNRSNYPCDFVVTVDQILSGGARIAAPAERGGPR